MNKLYNNQNDVATKIHEFLLKCGIFRKTQLKIIPFIIIGMILGESSVASDIAKNLKDDFSFVQLDSVIKRIKRFFTNKLFNPYDFYDKIIRHVISTYKKKHNDNRVHIIFDHMFSHDNYTVFMITMRIGKQGIPLWFRCFKGKNDSDAFQLSLLKEGISYVSSLFDDSFDLIFLADRWFDNTELFEHIDSLGHTYCIRIKGSVKTLIYSNLEKHKIWYHISNIKGRKSTSKFFYNVEITKKQYVTNLVISKSEGISEAWVIVTNGDPKRAIKDYGYRFGAIEFLFKTQKSNGFYIENTVNASLDYFTCMYTMTCFASLFLIIFGGDYTKNSSIYKNTKLTTHKVINGSRKRVMSLFNVGLTLFKRAFNSPKYLRIPFSFTLYDL